MNSPYRSLRTQQPALGPTEAVRPASAGHPLRDLRDQDMAAYIRRGRQARSQAFHRGLAAGARLTRRIARKASAASDAIHVWLFTPFCCDGRKP
jgi:hypothetical protein